MSTPSLAPDPQQGIIFPEKISRHRKGAKAAKGLISSLSAETAERERTASLVRTHGGPDWQG